MKYLDPAQVMSDLWLETDPENEDEADHGQTCAFPCQTDHGTQYFQQPGVALVSQPVSCVRSQDVRDFLEQYSEDFEDYCDDPQRLRGPVEVAKFAGELGRLSFGLDRTENANAAKYFQNLLQSGNGSALEHISFGFLFYGVSQSFAEEIARHPSVACSRVSQHIGADRLRFVERLEDQQSRVLHDQFLDRIDHIRQEYEQMTGQLQTAILDGCYDPAGTEAEHHEVVSQTALDVLSSEVETPILVTANVRVWRTIIDQCVNPEAAPEVRNAILRVFLRLWEHIPELLQDYRLFQLPDGSYAVDSDYRKV